MLEAPPPYDGLPKRAAYIACLIKGNNLPNKICGYMVQLTFGLNIGLGNDVKGPSTELFDHGDVWFATNTNPDISGLLFLRIAWGDVKRQISKGLFL